MVMSAELQLKDDQYRWLCSGLCVNYDRGAAGKLQPLPSCSKGCGFPPPFPAPRCQTFIISRTASIAGPMCRWLGRRQTDKQPARIPRECFLLKSLSGDCAPQFLGSCCGAPELLNGLDDACLAECKRSSS